MAGLYYKALYGKDQYEYDEDNYQPGVLGHISGFFMGLASPLDIASLAFGGVAGGVGKTKAGNFLLKRWG